MAVPEFHARINNTSSIPRLIEEVSPQQGSENTLVYVSTLFILVLEGQPSLWDNICIVYPFILSSKQWFCGILATE
jgi:hypothetical protein